VATSEVAEALSVVDGIVEANVYGVRVPGNDGRAGMAALVTRTDFDPSRLAQRLEGSLPAYARPVFLRLMPEMEITGTFKQRKIDLMKDGFDPRRIANPIYALDPKTLVYKPLDATNIRRHPRRTPEALTASSGRADGIEFDVTATIEEIAIAVDRRGAVAALPQGVGPPLDPV